MLTPHNLWGTCASLPIAAECNVQVLQLVLGHKTRAMTFDRYGHLFSDDGSGAKVGFGGKIADELHAQGPNRTRIDAWRTVSPSWPV